MTTETDALWLAVDSLTKPSTRRLTRTDETEALQDLQKRVEWNSSHAYRQCSVAAYREAQAVYKTAVTSHGTIPSLWKQAEAAVSGGAEKAEGQPSPKATRSPADLALMETMADIREAIQNNLAGRGLKPRPTVPEQIRQLAANLKAEHVDWWTFRFAQWQRVLESYLQAVENGPKPVRLRSAPCPECGAKSVLVDTDDGPVVASPLLIDFRDGYVRAATCSACSHAWWRGEELLELAERIAYDTPKRTDAAAI